MKVLGVIVWNLHLENHIRQKRQIGKKKKISCLNKIVS